MTDYDKLSTYEKEEYIAAQILKYLQKFRQPVTRAQITDHLIKINAISNDVLTPVKSKDGSEYVPFNQRLTFGLSSLYKSGLIDRPKRGVSEITELGKKVNANDGEHLHKIFVEGWKKS